MRDPRNPRVRKGVLHLCSLPSLRTLKTFELPRSDDLQAAFAGDFFLVGDGLRKGAQLACLSRAGRLPTWEKTHSNRRYTLAGETLYFVDQGKD